MQLSKIKYFVFLCLIPLGLNAQIKKEEKVEAPEINFLFDYYEQDGDHSPVTGGKGTEKLENMAPMLMINVPIDTIRSINANIGVDYYTSASSNKIDKYVTSASSKYISSASSKDIRGHIDLGYTHKLKKKKSYSLMCGYSKEFDVGSANIGFGWSKLSKDDNTEFSVKFQSYYDTWLIITPGELRGDFRGYGEYYGNNSKDYAKDTRLSNNINMAFSRVLNKRMQLTLLADFVYQQGLLYTPFHRVYFKPQIDEKYMDLWSMLAQDQQYAMFVDAEKLPSSRIKVPLGIRYHYFINDYLILRAYYRYYWDDFDINAHTVNIEMPIKLNRYWTLYPFYRYHTQTASRYFKKFGEAKMKYDSAALTYFVPIDEFYTSDYDLSALKNYKWGIGLKYSPLYGIARMKIDRDANRLLKLKYLTLRYANYSRSDGLKAWTIAFDAGLLIEKRKKPGLNTK